MACITPSAGKRKADAARQAVPKSHKRSEVNGPKATPTPPVSKKVIAGGILASVVVILLMVFWPKPPDPAMGRTKIVFLGPAYQELSDVAPNSSKDIMLQAKMSTLTCSFFSQGMDTKLVVLIAANQAPDVLAIGVIVSRSFLLGEPCCLWV